MADPSKPGVPFGITGIPAPNVELRTKNIPYAPDMPVRQEITKFAEGLGPQGKEQWTLYVLALEKFKAMPVDEKLSYFQVAGIHAYPSLTWDDGEPGEGGWYCAHGTLTFPTWHRVYMLLFEQLVWKNMKAVITEWELPADEDAAWVKAADNWRLPYWDWARKQMYTESFSLPEVLTQTTVKIYPPKAKEQQYPQRGNYPNPLYGFDNPETDETTGEPRPFGKMPEGKEKYNIPDNAPPPERTGGKLLTSKPANNKVLPWSLVNSTGRWGIQIKPGKTDRYTGLDGINNFTAANQFFGAGLIDKNGSTWARYNPGDLSDKVNRMMTHGFTATWGIFASTKWEQEQRDVHGFMSLEDVHNAVHMVTGGGNFDTGVGHMSDVPVAAFDPIFWLHHCQIDHLLAMWQALNWQLWWDRKASDFPSKDPDLRPEPDAEPSDDLKPFHRYDNKPDFWKSDDCRDWTKLGYQYDDLVPKSEAITPDNYLDESRYKTDLETHVDHIYPGAGQAVSKIRAIEAIKTPDGLPKESGKPFDDYIINVVYDRYALGGTSYSINFYLGGTPNQDVTHFVQENYIGNIFTFTGNSADPKKGCQNCKRQAEKKVLSLSQLPITISILNHIFDTGNDHPIEDFTEEQVTDYLKLHLRWEFVQHGGARVDEDKFPRTKIAVWRGRGEPKYIRPEKPQQADLTAIAALPALALNTLPVNPAVDLAQKAGNSPDYYTLPPRYSAYQPVYAATQGKKYGAEDPNA